MIKLLLSFLILFSCAGKRSETTEAWQQREHTETHNRHFSKRENRATNNHSTLHSTEEVPDYAKNVAQTIIETGKTLRNERLFLYH